MHPEADGAGARKIEILSRFCGFSRLCAAENFLIGRPSAAPSASIRDGDCGWRATPFRARRAPVRDGRGGGSKGGRTKAASQAFLQAFPNLGCFCPSFSKQSFGRFVGFQGVASLKNLNDVSPNFLWLPPPFSRNPDRRRAAFRRPRHLVRARSAVRAGLRCSLVEGIFMAEERSGSREFEPSRYSGFWKHISIIFRKEAAFDRHCERGEAIHGPAAARSPNSPRKQPEDVQTAYPFRPRPRTAEAPFSACSEVEPEASAVTGRSSNSAQDLKSSLVIRCCLSQRDEE
jgi:hypothetical protein